MKSYMWDLGFDWNSDPNDDGTYFLKTGLVEFPDNIVASSSLPIQPNSVVGFNIFNATSNGALGSGTACIMQTLTMVFRANEQSQSTTCPFNYTNTNHYPIPGTTVMFFGLSDLTSEPPGGSTIMGPGPFPCWFAGSFTAVNQGRFKFSIDLEIWGPGGMKHFVEDPEMIIGSDG